MLQARSVWSRSSSSGDDDSGSPLTSLVASATLRSAAKGATRRQGRTGADEPVRLPCPAPVRPWRRTFYS